MGRLQTPKAAASRRRSMRDVLTRPFAEIVQDRVRREPAFGVGLLQEAAQCMLNGELGVARNLVRDVIKGSIGYAKLSRRTGMPEKSLVRMFGRNGNPTAANLSRIFEHLQRYEGVLCRCVQFRSQARRRRNGSVIAPRGLTSPYVFGADPRDTRLVASRWRSRRTRACGSPRACAASRTRRRRSAGCRRQRRCAR